MHIEIIMHFCLSLCLCAVLLLSIMYVELFQHLWNEAQVIMIDALFDVFFNLVCQNFIKNLCLYGIRKILFLYCGIMQCVQGNCGLIKIIEQVLSVSIFLTTLRNIDGNFSLETWQNFAPVLERFFFGGAFNKWFYFNVSYRSV